MKFPHDAPQRKVLEALGFQVVRTGNHIALIKVVVKKIYEPPVYPYRNTCL